jgi:predicted NUDIX family NTP pyrophosphohydrolase
MDDIMLTFKGKTLSLGMKKSAGILLFRITKGVPEFFLVHPGGPFWKNKDNGSWSIPKGEFYDEEDAWLAALREFKEETGSDIDTSDHLALSPVKQKNGKLVYAWAVQGDINASEITSNVVEIELPVRSGRKIKFPEIDKAAWFSTKKARSKIIPAQAAFIDEVLSKIIK